MLTVTDVQVTLAVTVNKKIPVCCQLPVSKKEVHFHAIILGLQSKIDLGRLHLRRASLSRMTTEGRKMAM